MDPISSDQITQARTEAQTAGQRAVNFSASGNTLADELRKAVSERYNASNEAKIGAEARGNFLSAGPEARNYVADLVSAGNILSPTQQAQILASKRAASLIPVMAANTMDTAAFGNMGDLINSGVGAYNAEAQRQAGLAQLAQNSYSDLLNSFYKQLEEKRTADLAPLQKELLQAQIAKTKADAVSGGSSTSLQAVEINGQLYNYNPKTGEYTKANITGGKSKYGEEDVANFANSVADGSMKITAVPQEIRGSVQSVVDQLTALPNKKWWPDSWWGQPFGLNQ